jgi:hypothetical protein
LNGCSTEKFDELRFASDGEMKNGGDHGPPPHCKIAARTE